MSARDPRWPGLVLAYLEHNRGDVYGENLWVSAEHFEPQPDGSLLRRAVGEPTKRIAPSSPKPKKTLVVRREPKPARVHRDVKPANVLPEQRGLFS